MLKDSQKSFFLQQKRIERHTARHYVEKETQNWRSSSGFIPRSSRNPYNEERKIVGVRED